MGGPVGDRLPPTLKIRKGRKKSGRERKGKRGKKGRREGKREGKERKKKQKKEKGRKKREEEREREKEEEWKGNKHCFNRNMNINDINFCLEVFTKLHKFSIKIPKSSSFWGGHIPLKHPPVHASTYLALMRHQETSPIFPSPPPPRHLGLATPLEKNAKASYSG